MTSTRKNGNKLPKATKKIKYIFERVLRRCKDVVVPMPGAGLHRTATLNLLYDLTLPTVVLRRYTPTVYRTAALRRALQSDGTGRLLCRI